MQYYLNMFILAYLTVTLQLCYQCNASTVKYWVIILPIVMALSGAELSVK